MFKNTTVKKLGIEISSNRINFVCYQQNENADKPCLFHSEIFDTEMIKNGSFNNEEAVLKAIETFIKKNSLKDIKTSISISSNDVYLKKINLPDLPENELDMVVTQEIEKNLPFGADELCIDYQKISTYIDTYDGSRKTDIIYAASQRYLIDTCLKLGKKLKINITEIKVSSLCVLNELLNEKSENQKDFSCVFIYVDTENTDIILVKNSAPIEIYSIQTGEREIFELKAEIENADSFEIEALKEKLNGIYTLIKDEINNLTDGYYSKTSQEKIFDKIIISNNSQNLNDFEDFLQTNSTFKTELFSNQNASEESTIVTESMLKPHIIDLNLLNDISKHTHKSKKVFLNEAEKNKLKISFAVFSILFLIVTSAWSYFKLSNNETTKRIVTMRSEYELIKPKLDILKAQTLDMKEKKEIIDLKLKAQDILNENDASWFSILKDINSVVPQSITLKEISQSDITKIGKKVNVITINGSINAESPEPLKYISYFVININENLPPSTRLTKATIQEISFNEDLKIYEFSIVSDLKQNKQDDLNTGKANE